MVVEWYVRGVELFEVIQLREDNILDIESFIDNRSIIILGYDDYCRFERYKEHIKKHGRGIRIKEGVVNAVIGDYILKDAHGNVFPCRQRTFNSIYDRIGYVRK